MICKKIEFLAWPFQLTNRSFKKSVSGFLIVLFLNISCVTKPEQEPHDLQKRQKALDTDCSFNHDADRRVPLAEWTCKSTQDGTLRALTPEELEILSYGSLTKYEIEAEIRNKLSGIKNCFEDLIKKPGPDKNPDRHKAVRYISQFRIEKDGKVVEATGDFKLDPDNSLLSMPETIASKECFNGIARTYQFPPPRGGGIVQVKYPFVINFAPPKSKQKL